MAKDGTPSGAKRFDQTPAALVIMTGVVLGATCAILLDLAIGNAVRALSNGAPTVTDFVKTIAQALRACVAAVGLFWIRAYADDIYNKPAKSGDKVTLKRDAIALLSWTFFAALSVLMSAKIAVKGVESLIERHFERELLVINDGDADRLPPSLAYTKVSWHFFFEEGNLCKRPGCDLKEPVHASLEQSCHTDNLAVHGKNELSGKDPKDDRNRPVGTSFYRIDYGEGLERLVGIIDVAAQCAKLDDDPYIAESMLTLTARSSSKNWDQCTNGDELDQALREARAVRAKELFEDARKLAIAAAHEDLKPYIRALRLNAPSEGEAIDFSDDRYAEANLRVDDTSKGDTPFNITQSVAIVLRNPAGCRLIDEQPVGQTAALADPR